MGFRINWYEADKKTPVTITKHDDWTDVDINGRCILHNNGTEFFMNLLNTEDFRKEVTCLYEDSDVLYYTISKAGFKMIILEYRKRVIEYMKEYLEEFMKYDFTDEKKLWLGSRLIDEWKSEITEWESEYKDDRDNEIHYFNIKFCDNPSEFEISSSWKYKYAIYDMLTIYRSFDWDNYTMVVYGG